MKKIISYSFTSALLTFLLCTAYAQSPNRGRAPSVEPLVEVSIEERNQEVHKDQPGYNFAAKENQAKARVPANIVTKTSSETTSSYLGPLIFLFALPLGLWIIVYKKLGHKKSEEASAHPSEKKKVTKFYKANGKPSTGDSDDNNDDNDGDNLNFPKAS